MTKKEMAEFLKTIQMYERDPLCRKDGVMWMTFKDLKFLLNTALKVKK